ncbi:hypothetical protein [Methylobacterium sp. JK268]
MPRIARSDKPLYQTIGDPIAWPIRITGPSGAPLDLTGASAVCVLHGGGRDRVLMVGTLGPDGYVRPSGSAALSADVPLGALSQLRLTLTDSQGVVTRYVWPVIGEIP